MIYRRMMSDNRLHTSNKMTRRTLLPAAYGLLFVMVACSPGPMTEDALMDYVRDPAHGLHISEQRGDLEVSALYRPTDLLVAQELGSERPTEEALAEFRNKYGAYAYFILGFSKENKDALYNTAASYADFSENLQKLSFRLQEYLHMTTSSKDTVYMADYHFSRMHGMGGSTQVLVAFDRQDIADKDWVQLNLTELGFGAGRVNLRFDMSDIKRAPSIDFIKMRNSDQ